MNLLYICHDVLNKFHQAQFLTHCGLEHSLLHIQVSAGDESRMAGAEMSCMAGADMSRMAGDGDVLYGRR
jgi:hypothetical protein